MDPWIISAIVIGAVLFIYFVYALMQPRTWEVTEAVQVNAAQAQVFDYLNTIRNWETWTAWNNESPQNYKFDYEGPESGEGARQNWKAKGRKGWVKITGGESPERIDYRFIFGKGGHQMEGSLTLKSISEQESEITWTLNGDAGDNPSLRLMAKMMKPYMSRDLRTGLDRLKGIVQEW